MRYSESTQVDSLSVENTIYLWDDSVDLFQKSKIGNQDLNHNVSYGKETALKFAKMIIEKYEGKK